MHDSNTIKFRKFLLRLIVFSLPFHDLASPIPLLNLSLFILMIYLVFSFPYLANTYYKKIHFEQKPIFILVILYLWISIISILNYNPYTNFSFSFFRQFPMYIAAMFIFSDAIIKGLLSFKDILSGFIFGFAFMTLLFYTGIGVSSSDDGRATIFGINQNAVAIYSDIAVLFILNYIHNYEMSKSRKYLFYLFIPAFVNITILTASRGGFVSLLLGVAIYFIAKNKGLASRVKNLLLALSFIVVLSFFFLSNEVVYSRIFENEEGLVEDRTIIWEAVYSMLENNYLFGIGLFGYETEITRIMGRFRATHNEYLTILVYSGVIGLGILFYYLFKTFIPAYKTLKVHGNSLFISLFAILIFTFFKAGGSLTSLLIWFMFTLILTSDSLSKSIKAK
jgi:O-antigen ligase